MATHPRPDYVQNFEKPEGTEIKYIAGQWYLYERVFVYDPVAHRSRKASGPLLGSIKPDGFHPTRSRKPRSTEEPTKYQQYAEKRASRNLPPRSKELEEWLEKASEGFPPPSMSGRSGSQKTPAEESSLPGPSDSPEEHASEESNAALPGSAPTEEEGLLDPTLPDTDASPGVPGEEPPTSTVLEMASPASPDHAPGAATAESPQEDRPEGDLPATREELEALRQEMRQMEQKMDALSSLLTQVLTEFRKVVEMFD